MARRYSRHIVVEEVGSSRKAAGVVEVVDSRSHLPEEEGDRNLAEVYEAISTNIENGGASNPTGSSLAGVGTAEGVVLRILRGIQSLGNPTYPVAGGCYGGEIRDVICLLSA